MFRKVLAIIATTVLLVIMAGGLVFAQEKPVIEIYDQVEVVAKAIYLGDIAKLSEFGDVEDAVKEIVLGSLVIPGSSIRFSVGQIQVRLRQAGFDPSDFTIKGATQVVVTAAKNSVSQEKTSNTTNVIFSDANEGRSTITLQAYEVVVPTTNINRYDIITEEVLQIETKEGYTIPRDLATMDDLIGKRATRLLVAGTILHLSAAEAPPVIERNIRVTIIAEGNGIRISTVGVTQQGGGIGDIIPVKNLSSNEIIYAEITSPDSVKVNLGGSSQ